MKLSRLGLLAASLLICSAAIAQYQWIDLNGRRVFSDRPPPAEVPDKNILVQPGEPPAQATQAAPEAEPVVGDILSVPTSASSDPELEKKARAAEAAEQAAQKAAEQKEAAARAENCRRARNSAAMLESGQRMAQMNEKGEREILTDEQRAAELALVRSIIASDCD